MKHLNRILAANWPFLILLPVCIWNFSTGLNSWHDWGGDFVQYIWQALNLMGEHSPGKDNYLPNPDHLIIGPEEYPNGLPLLLTIPYAIAGESIAAFLCLIAVFYILYGVVIMLLLKRYFSPLMALVITLFILFNPHFIAFKAQIASDIPFAVFFTGAIFLLLSKNLNPARALVAAGLAAYAIFTRSMGWSLPLGVVLYLLVNFKDKRLPHKNLGIFTGATLLLVFTLQWFFPATAESSYTAFYRPATILSDIWDNLHQYALILRDLVPVYFPGTEFLQVAIGAGIMSFFILGFALHGIKKPGLMWWILLVYIGSGLLYSTSIFHRFFYPIIPMIIIYAGQVWHKLRLQPGIKYLAGLALLVATGFNMGHAHRVKHHKKVQAGPQHPTSVEAFQYLQENVGEGETVNFIKPRVLAHYTALPSFTNHPEATPGTLEEKFSQYRVHWLLLCDDLHNPALEAYVEKFQPPVFFQNERMRVYRVE